MDIKDIYINRIDKILKVHQMGLISEVEKLELIKLELDKIIQYEKDMGYMRWLKLKKGGQ